jgi:hypothetical protein
MPPDQLGDRIAGCVRFGDRHSGLGSVAIASRHLRFPLSVWVCYVRRSLPGAGGVLRIHEVAANAIREFGVRQRSSNSRVEPKEGAQGRQASLGHWSPSRGLFWCYPPQQVNVSGAPDSCVWRSIFSASRSSADELRRLCEKLGRVATASHKRFSPTADLPQKSAKPACHLIQRCHTRLQNGAAAPSQRVPTRGN